MSKIIEALRRDPVEKSAGSKKPTPNEQLIQVESTGRELTQERLADIYFSAVGKPKHSEPPVIIRVVEKSKAAASIPWVITSVAFLITAIALFSTKRLLVDVRVIDDKTLLRSFDDEQSSGATGDSTGTTQTGSQPSIALPLEDFFFEGAAILQSSKDSRRLTLVNSSVSPFARAVLRPSQSFDLSRSKLVFDVRGAKGGEKLGVALKDIGNVQAFKKGIAQPFTGGLSTDWKETEVFLLDLNEIFDTKRVASIRFEFGTKDTENHSGDTIYVRNLRLVPLG